ncbi:hypothetical protein AB0D08_38835 [Kitasatospora sp. NPDC048540]|uniref:hypothetical protein n=1 Tax=unclassified Kitasatospora TaxID=2633591 RepID=UPI0011EA61B8|nr:hypothetical protein [Kitasatospora sp. MBT63]
MDEIRGNCCERASLETCFDGPSPLQPYTDQDFLISPATARLVRASAREQSSSRNLESQIRLFQEWCTARGRVALPCTTATLIEYVGWMIESAGYEPNTVAAYSSSVVTWQERATPGNTRPGTLITRGMIAAYRQAWVPHRTERRSPAVSEPDLEEMLATCDRGGRPADIRDAAILSLGWHLPNRRIELTQLLVTGVTMHEDGVDVRVVSRTSPTEGPAAESWVPVRDEAPALCPVRRLKAWLEYGRRIHQPPDEALFRALDKAGRLAVRLTPQSRPTHSDGTPKDDHELTAEDWRLLSCLSGEAVNAFVKARARAAFGRVAHLTEEQRSARGFSALISAETAAKVTMPGLRAGGRPESG